MTSDKTSPEKTCELCAPTEPDLPAGERCGNCLRKGDLVGEVVWKRVAAEVEEATQSKRVMFMVTGLSAMFLEGIARKAPREGEGVDGRSWVFAVHPEAAENLQIAKPATESDEAATHWRHSDAADVILFAVSDSDKDGIGAGLGPVARLDEAEIVNQINAWSEFLGETSDADEYLKKMLGGLRDSSVFINLEMWVDFILAVKDQGFTDSVYTRVQQAAHALHVPNGGIAKLPSLEKAKSSKIKDGHFRVAFSDASRYVKCYASLKTPKQDPVDLDSVHAALDEISSESDDEETLRSLEIVRELLKDEPDIRPGRWLKSQRNFCALDWNRFGSRVFEGRGRSATIDLGAETLAFIDGNHSHDVTEEDRRVLESMGSRNPKEPKEDEVDFYNRWKDRLAHIDAAKLNKKWQKRVFPREISGGDLLSALSDGFEALVAAAGEALLDMEEPKVLVRAMQHERATYWENRDTGTLELFRFELKSIRGVLADGMEWDIDACFKNHETSDSNSPDARRVDLDLYLMEADEMRDLAGMKTPPNTAPRVRVGWQPIQRARQEPISYALPGDVSSLAGAAESGAGIFRRMEFAPNSEADGSRVFSMSLREVKSFSDVFGTQDGRTFHTTVNPEDDALREIRESLLRLEKDGGIESDAAQRVREALDSFEKAYHDAIVAIGNDPATGFASDLVNRQAEAFGALCSACRRNIPGDSKGGREIRPLVAELGVLRSDGQDSMAILAAWHPLRLAERRARILELAQFVSAVLGSETARAADLAIAFQERRAFADRWAFPEVAVVGGETMVAVENVSGYALLVPLGQAWGNREALEESAPAAADKFVEGLDRYLDIHPHEATSLSAVVYESESGSLPQEIARLLARRIHDNPDLRCDLTITHSDQERLRKIYHDQNVLLGTENLSDVARGFLSRLRVDVKPHRGASKEDDAVSDIDLAFLHDAVSHHAEPEWVHEHGSSDDLAAEFDMLAVRRPRRKLDEANAEEIGIYLALPFPPRAVAEYHDLLYEMDKSAVLPADSHAALIRRVRFADPKIEELINGAHELAEWVVTFDNLSSRSLLQKCGVRIIRDISVPGSTGRVIISVRDIDRELIQKIRGHLKEACGVQPDEAERLAERIAEDVREISGQKLLAAARFTNASREMIGLSLMRAVMEASLPEESETPIWFSLDDYRSWFVSGKGETADALAMSIIDRDGEFEILIQVGEAKFVAKDHDVDTIKKAKVQVRESVERLRGALVDNRDFISRGAWCSRLAELMVNQEALARRLPNERRRGKFIRALTSGDVAFRICGEAVIGLHDNHDSSVQLYVDEDAPHIRWHVLPTPVILETLRAAEREDLHVRDGLRDVQWHRGEPCPRPTDVATDSQPTPAAKDEGDDAAPAKESVADGDEPSNDSDVVEHEDGSESPDADDAAPAIAADSVPTMIPKPVLDILLDMKSKEPSSVDDTQSREWAEETCTRTQRALSHFEMHAEFADPKFRLTPNGVLIGFRGHSTLTVDKLEKKRSEMLTTHGIDVVDIRPGPGTISLFVKREPRAQVPLASTWLDAPWPDRETGDLTNFAIGVREDDGNLLFLNLAGKCGGYDEHGPHTLIAGETGSGKGILTQGLLLQLVAFNDPKNVELVLVDPKKGVDFLWLEGVPHMREKIVTERQQAQEAFGRLVHEMDRRYDLFRKESVSDIARYNARVESGDRLPRTFLVHDELGSWMAQEKDYKETVLSSVSNLGMKARAAGIHLVLITQRADADAVPPRLRDNMNNRLCLKVQNSTGSTMVLNKVGAERLLGKGHLACQLANQPMPAGQEFFVVQVPYADPDDMERLAEAAKSHWGG